MKRETCCLLGMLLVLSSIRLMAHPGHGLTQAEPLHSLTSPAHLLGVVIAGILVCLVGTAMSKRAVGRVLQFGGALAAVGAVVIWGLR